MTPLEEILVAIVPGLAKLLATALAEAYDPKAELEAMLNMQRALADQRVKIAVAGK